MRYKLLIAFCAICCFAGNLSAQKTEPSVAERAAAARGDQSKPLDPQVAGHTVKGDYSNDFFGLQVKRPQGWEAISRGEMNVDEAFGRAAMGLKAGVSGGNRVFGLRDGKGSNLAVAIHPVPPGTDPTQASNEVQQALKSQFPGARFFAETASLGDAAHRFTGFRVSYTVEDQPIVQSLQIIFVKGYAVVFTASSLSDEALTAFLRQLRASIVWTPASAAAK